MMHQRRNYNHDSGGRGGGGGGGWYMDYDNNSASDSSSSSSAGFFSPREGRAVSLVNAFSPTPTNAYGNGNGNGNDTPAATSNNNNNNQYFFHGNAATKGNGKSNENNNANDDIGPAANANGNTTTTATTTDVGGGDAINTPLPRLHDTSWLGANVSAIVEEMEDQDQDHENDGSTNTSRDFGQLLNAGSGHHQTAAPAADAGAAAAAAGTGGGRGRSFGLGFRNGKGNHASSFFGGLRRIISTTPKSSNNTGNDGGGSLSSGNNSNNNNNNGNMAATTEQTKLLFGRRADRDQHRPAQNSTVVRDERDTSSNLNLFPLQQNHFPSSSTGQQYYNLDGSIRGGVSGFVGFGIDDGVGPTQLQQLQGYPVPLEEEDRYQYTYGNNIWGTEDENVAPNFTYDRQQQYYDGSSIIGYTNDYNYNYYGHFNDRHNSKYNSCKRHMAYILRRIFLSRYTWRLPPILSGLFLFCVALHDLFLTYISYRRDRDVEPPYSLGWSWPLGSPSASSMLRFGAFSTERVMMTTTTTSNNNNNGGGDVGSGEYWRCLTSLIWSTSSFVEWLVILAAWFVLEKAVQTRVTAEERVNYKNDRRRTQNHHHQHQHVAVAPSGNDFAQTFASSFHATSFQPPLAASSPLPPTMSSTYANMFSTYDYTMMSSLDIVWWLWPLLYVLSAFTGQLWVLSFGGVGGGGNSYVDSASYGQYFNGANDNGINGNVDVAVDNVVGCVSWGTAGVACGIGVIWPSQRLRLFVLVIFIVILSQLDQSTNAPSSVFGIVGASFWGWSLCGSVAFLLSSLSSSTKFATGNNMNTTTSRRKNGATQKTKDYYYTENSFHQDDDVRKSMMMHPGVVSSRNSILHTLGGIISILVLISIWFLPIFNMLWYQSSS